MVGISGPRYAVHALWPPPQGANGSERLEERGEGTHFACADCRRPCDASSDLSTGVAIP